MAEEERMSSEPLEGSELDAEGEEVDEEFGETAVNGLLHDENMKPEEEHDSEGENDEADAEGEEVEEEDESADKLSANGSEESDTDASSDDNEDWQADSDADGDAKGADSNLCIFCGQDEENDPSAEYEEYLDCKGCRKNAHRQCARDEDSLDTYNEAAKWRCPGCVENGIGEVEDTSSISSEEETSEPKPSVGLFSSMFASMWDKTRSLRKRKSSEDESSRPSRKRRLASDASAGAAASVSGSDDDDEDDIIHPGRPRRQRKPDKPLCHIVSSEGLSLIVSINADPIRVARILSKKPRRRYKQRAKKLQEEVTMEPEPPHYPALPNSYNSNFLPLFERDGDDSKSKPYGGILSDADADTSKTFPLAEDRKKFEDVRERAEEAWKQKMADTNNAPEPTKPSQKMSGPPSKIKCINFGGFEIDTLNAAPYPEEYSQNKILYICEFCLKYMNSDFVAWRHKLKCPEQHPPGDEIYRDGRYSFFEVDGRKSPVYCQNLCLLAKLFLGSKTLYYDVEPFLFYVMTENDDLGCHFVGYFSKEKRSSSMNNVSCILVLPIYQRRGFGQMLIDFSYLLTRQEKKTGSPEKPLSDMGLVSYRQYWRLMMCHELLEQKETLSVMELTKRTGMTPDDVVSALEGLRALVRDPITRKYALRLDYDYYREYIKKYDSKGYPKIDPGRLVWVPYVMNRGLSQHYEGTGHVQTVAPREEGEEVEEEDGSVQDEEENKAELTNGHHAKTNGVNGEETEGSGPGTPQTNGASATEQAHQLLLLASGGPNAEIPPIRYEIWPPIPGLGRKKGRAPVSAKRKSGTTPRSSSAMGMPALHMPHSNGSASGPTANGSPVLRRTRSALADVSAEASSHDDDEAFEDVDRMEMDEALPVANGNWTHENEESVDEAPGVNDYEDAERDMDLDEEVDAEGEVG